MDVFTNHSEIALMKVLDSLQDDGDCKLELHYEYIPDLFNFDFIKQSKIFFANLIHLILDND